MAMVTTYDTRTLEQRIAELEREVFDLRHEVRKKQALVYSVHGDAKLTIKVSETMQHKIKRLLGLEENQ